MLPFVWDMEPFVLHTFIGATHLQFLIGVTHWQCLIGATHNWSQSTA